MIIYFTRYGQGKLTRTLSLYYHELMMKQNLMVDYMLDKVLENITMITGIEKINDGKILIDKLRDDLILENAVILITCLTCLFISRPDCLDTSR